MFSGANNYGSSSYRLAGGVERDFVRIIRKHLKHKWVNDLFNK